MPPRARADTAGSQAPARKRKRVQTSAEEPNSGNTETEGEMGGNIEMGGEMGGDEETDSNDSNILTDFLMSIIESTWPGQGCVFMMGS